jgi:hypothetical protein
MQHQQLIREFDPGLCKVDQGEACIPVIWL